MIDGAVHIGVPRDLATEMVLQTFAGSARLAQETGRHPADLKNMVTSPGGTTTEGLLALERAGVRAALIEAVVAAYNKSKALGG
jgi:pyrroline-5-carboxylate reductase